MKQIKSVTVCDSDDIDPPEAFQEFMQFWADLWASVPAEFRYSAKIELEGGDAWGVPVVKVRVSYLREETDDEEAERERGEDIRAHNEYLADIQRLEALQRKLGIIK